MDVEEERMDELRKQKRQKGKAAENMVDKRRDISEKQKKKKNDGETARGEELITYSKRPRFEDEFIVCDEMGGISSEEMKKRIRGHMKSLLGIDGTVPFPRTIIKGVPENELIALYPKWIRNRRQNI